LSLLEKEDILNINLQDKNGKTALMIASFNKNIVSLLNNYRLALAINYYH
jgi:ankyrin repeat protein